MANDVERSIFKSDGWKLLNMTPSSEPVVTENSLELTLRQDADSLHRAVQLSSLENQPPASAPGYRIVRKLGAGKFGSVWLAREQNTGKHVAIKFYASRRGVDWSLLSREVEKLAVLYTSRNIVGLLEVGWDHDPPYYVMEYLENGSLAGLLERGPMPIGDAVRVATRVGQALVHAHGSGILHCDLKPANVLLDQDFEPRLCDFGQSRLVDEQVHSLGTLFYMAPEQADLRATPDARWDVYALGALMFQMICGVAPFRSSEVEQRLQKTVGLEERLHEYRRIVRHSPRPNAHRKVPGVDAPLAEIIDRCLAPDPQRRFPNVQVVLDRLMARERQRQRRPLIVMGLILPVLLMASATPLALSAIRQAAESSQQAIIRRAIESDLLSANLLAHSIDRELQDRLESLKRISANPELAELVTNYGSRPQPEREPLWTWLNTVKEKIDEARKTQSLPPDASWFLTDAQGVQRWRHPTSTTIDDDFSHRDYFHARDREFEAGKAPLGIKPLSRPHVSIAYRSTSSGKYVVALSTPIWNAEHTEVIGVLARTTELAELLIEYSRQLPDDKIVTGRNRTVEAVENVDRVIALLDSRRWHLLSHPGLSENELLDADYQNLTVDDDVKQRLEKLILSEADPSGDNALRFESHYRDPLAKRKPELYDGDWLAAFCPVGAYGWIAIVQERRRASLRPIEELSVMMGWYAVAGLLIAITLIVGSWAFITRVMNERSGRSRNGLMNPLSNGFGGSGVGTGGTGGGTAGTLTGTWRPADGR